MPVTLTDRQSAKIAAALRRGSYDAMRIADALDPAGRTHFLIEVTDMGQFAKDWEHLKTIIRQKDDAIDRQTAQIAALQKQLSAQQPLDTDDQKAVAELRKTVGDNAPAAAPPAAAAPVAPHPPAAPVAPHPPAAPVVTFTK